MEWLDIIQGPIDYILMTKVKLNKGRKVNIVFLRINRFKIGVRDATKISIYSLFNSSDNFNYTTTAVGLSVSKIGRGQRSEGSGRSETDSNSLKCNWMYTLAKACVLRLLIVLYCAFVLH